MVFSCEDLNSKCFVDFLLGLLRHRINDLVLTDLLFDLGLSRIDGLLRSLLRTDPALLSLFYQCAAVFSIKNEEEYTDLKHRLRGI